MPCNRNQLLTDFMNSWKSSYWSLDDQSKLGVWRVGEACGCRAFSASTSTATSTMALKPVCWITDMESRSMESRSRALGHVHDQGSCCRPATWCGGGWVMGPMGMVSIVPKMATREHCHCFGHGGTTYSVSKCSKSLPRVSCSCSSNFRPKFQLDQKLWQFYWNVL